MASQPKDKEGQIPFDLPVNREIIFSNHKNVYKKRIERRQRSMMKNISFISRFLSDGEEIFLITTGCSPVSFTERFWTGLNVFNLKHSLLIFTDRRVFHIPMTKEHSYRDSIAHFYYADCISMGVKRTNLIVRYKNGKKEKFHHVAHREEKKLKTLLKTMSFEGRSGESKGRVHLCPRCTRELTEGVFVCANCGLEFKNRAKALKISIIFPGGGYFYARHPFLGIADALIEVMLIALIIMCMIVMAKGVKYSDYALVISAVALVFEKLLTIYHSSIFIKEFIPKEKEIKELSGEEPEK